MPNPMASTKIRRADLTTDHIDDDDEDDDIAGILYYVVIILYCGSSVMCITFVPCFEAFQYSRIYS